MMRLEDELGGSVMGYASIFKAINIRNHIISLQIHSGSCVSPRSTSQKRRRCVSHTAGEMGPFAFQELNARVTNN